MVTKKELDMLRFYGGDIRKRTEEGKLLIINSSENSKDPKDLLWRDKDAYRTYDLRTILFQRMVCINPMPVSFATQSQRT